MLKKYLTNSKNINTFSKKYISYLQNVFNSLDFKKLDDLEREFLKMSHKIDEDDSISVSDQIAWFMNSS